MIETLLDSEEFRRHRESAWKQNVDYWVSEPLRHVLDVGDYIADRVAAFCGSTMGKDPTLVDMGFGNAWLLRYLLDRHVALSYVGLDGTEEFVSWASRTYSSVDSASFLLADVEKKLDFQLEADIVVNAFNFFELCDLAQAMHNVQSLLRPGGRLFASTIDKTYLILALSGNYAEFRENLRRYEELPGIKFGFQNIDLGTDVSDAFEYPSVLYSLQDFIDEASRAGLRLVNYVEHPFTAKVVPKIYCHLEFENSGNSSEGTYAL